MHEPQWHYYADTTTGRQKLQQHNLGEAIVFVQNDRWLKTHAKGIVKLTLEEVWENPEYRKGA